ncbi:hypothetical protein [Streptomyces peucetius]|nr:hypothetical protein CGZ69_25060 [Streptomyces peucetius subsp. caesius ATCC 27952]
MDEATGTRGDALWSSPLRFQLWSYGGGHSTLTIRSQSGQGQDTEPIGLHFEAVERMNIGRSFQGLSLEPADDALLEEIAATGSLQPRPNPLLAIALRSRDARSWIVCSRVRVGVWVSTDGQSGFTLDPIHFSTQASRPT